MMFPHIRPYHEGASVPPHSFFIIREGSKAGMPCFKPNVKCFIVACTYKHYFDYFFSLIYGMYLNKIFKPHHRGIAVPFVRQEEIRKLIREAIKNP